MIVGRASEVQILEKVMKSKEAEFVAIVGRRRVGKTYLVRAFFKKAPHFFEVVGIKNAPLQQQLNNFSEALNKAFSTEEPMKKMKTWKQAFLLSSRFSASKTICGHKS